jgi:ATP-binding cassette, subfamily B, bacterial PglK
MKSAFQYFKEVLFLLGDNKKKLPFLVLVFLLSSFLDLLGIGLIAPYVSIIVDPSMVEGSKLLTYLDRFGFSTRPSDLLLTFGLALMATFLLKTIAGILINRSVLYFCRTTQAIALRSVLMKTYQNMKYTDYLERNSSEYIYHVQQLSSQFSQGILQSILRLTCDGIVGMMILITLAWTSGPALALLVLLLGGTIYSYDRYSKVAAQESGELMNKHSVRMVQGINEGLGGLKELRILGKNSYFHDLVIENARRFGNASAKGTVLATVPRFLLEFLLVSFIVLLVLSSLYSGADLKTVVPTLSMFGLAAIRLIPSVNQVIGGISLIRMGRNTVRILYTDIVNLKRDDSAEVIPSSTQNPEPFKQFELSNVGFSYPGSKQETLKNISMTFKEGESIGIIGKSGSGKTTLVDIILGLLEPTSGELNYNDRPLSTNLGDWRGQTAYLPQQVFLIDDTLKNNIALGVDEKDIDISLIQEAIKSARLSEVFATLPKGVDTILGDKGLRLSGGQRQRVALARAFYHNRNVLIMDESTSALDNQVEHEIVEEIKRLKGKKSMIVIAHRLTTLQYCDRIYRLAHGEIVEQGSYESVIGQVAINSNNKTGVESEQPQNG